MYPLVSFRHEAVDLVRSYKMPLTASYPLVPPNIQQLSCKNSCRPSPGDQPQHGTKWSNRRSSLVNARSPERDTRKLTAPAPRWGRYFLERARREAVPVFQWGTFRNQPSWCGSGTKELRHEEYGHLSCSWCLCDRCILCCGCRAANEGPCDAAR